jgi:hypothetical protein
MRGLVCRLKLLLDLTNTVILGSKSHGTRNHILLSQIQDFPFYRLLGLAGLWWRYSTPQPHRIYPSGLFWSGLECLEVKVTLRLTVSQSVSLGVEPHLGLMTRELASTIWQLRSGFCGAPSLTRGWVCLLYMLLGLPNAVFLGSESLGTRDHILLSQIWDFPFHHILRLAGPRWKYSTPPPHGF